MRDHLRVSKETVWGALVIPAATCGMALAVPAHWLFGPVGVAMAFGTSFIQAVALGLVVERCRRDAEAQLRRPHLRNSPEHRPGLFAPLVVEAVGLLEALEATADHALAGKNEAEAKSHQVRTRLRHLTAGLDADPDPLLLTDAEGAVVYANASASRLCGTADGAAMAGTMILKSGSLGPGYRRALPAAAAAVDELLSRPAAGFRDVEFSHAESGGDAGASADSESIHDDAPAGLPTNRANIRLLTDAEGRILGTCVRVADIRNETAERRRHGEFVSSVAHELKTPMAGIRAYAELLRDGEAETPEEREELCGFIEDQVDRLTRLVNNMLNLARIQSGVVKVQRQDCELNDILGPAVETVRTLAAEKQITLSSAMSGLYLAVHADRDLLGQAVINLLSNAIKYTPVGGSVRLVSRIDGDRAVIDVIDTGMGIPADCLPRLFERFYRVTRNNAAAAGTGLGLALVQYVVTDLHNGAVTVRSEVDAGSTFTVSLPFGHRDRLPRRESNRHPAALASAG